MGARESVGSALWLTNWKRRLPGRVPALLAIALGLFVAAATALGLNLVRLRESFTWVEHTNEVLRNIAATERALLEAESGERGYLLAGESSYLDSYNGSQARIPGLLETLRHLTSDNPDQTHRIDELRPNIEARLAQFKRAVELGPARLSDALAILATARSNPLTPRIEEQLGQLRQAELALLDERQQTTDHISALATLFAAAMGVLALLSAALGAFLLERQRTICGERPIGSDDAEA